MTHRPCIPLAAALALVLAGPAIAQNELPPGLRGAQLLPGWTEPDGARVLALELLLEPGWKTYWRSPGDTGLPPQLDWVGSDNLSHVTMHWPAPQAIRSGETLEMGYHDRLVLPLTAYPQDPGKPVDITAQIDVGVCENICVPVHLELRAPPVGTQSDPVITRALAAEPQRLDSDPACYITPLADGLRVAMDLPQGDATLAAVELTDNPQVWVSAADIVPGPKGLQAVVEMVAPSGKPFDLDRDALRLTVIPADGGRATETTGCAAD
ncbi:protein-disulfide reductase DsbD domain-containing protein [Paracoccus sp. Ld10]|uniref:protein-disulfide reductase DsbD domain-containing protein n=1 Tax=Paracoccus sp. Ld10 TaxID=649158 RepID=UPI0038676F88